MIRTFIVVSYHNLKNIISTRNIVSVKLTNSTMSAFEWNFGAIGATLGCILTLLIFTFIIYDIFKHEIDLHFHKKCGDIMHDRTPLTIRILMYKMAFLFPFHMLSLMVSMLFTSNNADCQMNMSISFFLLHLSESAVYLAFVWRIERVYRGSMFNIPMIRVYAVYIGIALYSLPYLLCIDWLLLDDIHYSKTHSLCIIEPLSVSSILLTVFQLLHTLIVVYCLHLFVAPLREMTKHSDCINQESVNSSLLALTTKYTVLHCSNAISSIILMALLLSSGAGHYYAMFHSLINATVMILLHPLQNDLFRKLCCLPLYLCALTHRTRPKPMISMKKGGPRKASADIVYESDGKEIPTNLDVNSSEVPQTTPNVSNQSNGSSSGSSQTESNLPQIDHRLTNSNLPRNQAKMHQVYSESTHLPKHVPVPSLPGMVRDLSATNQPEIEHRTSSQRFSIAVLNDAYQSNPGIISGDMKELEDMDEFDISPSTSGGDSVLQFNELKSQMTMKQTTVKSVNLVKLWSHHEKKFMNQERDKIRRFKTQHSSSTPSPPSAGNQASSLPIGIEEYVADRFASAVTKTLHLLDLQSNNLVIDETQESL